MALCMESLVLPELSIPTRAMPGLVMFSEMKRSHGSWDLEGKVMAKSYDVFVGLCSIC